MQQLHTTIGVGARKVNSTKYDFSDLIETKEDISKTMVKSHEFHDIAINDIINPVKEELMFSFEDMLSNSIMNLDSKTMTDIRSSIMEENDDVNAKNIQFMVQELEPTYVIELYAPLELNIDADSLRFNGDIKIELLPKKTRLALAIAAASLSASLLAALIALPPPYNVASAIALGGPLFVSSVGLLTQKR